MEGFFAPGLVLFGLGGVKSGAERGNEFGSNSNDWGIEREYLGVIWGRGFSGEIGGGKWGICTWWGKGGGG